MYTYDNIKQLEIFTVLYALTLNIVLSLLDSILTQSPNSLPHRLFSVYFYETYILFSFYHTYLSILK